MAKIDRLSSADVGLALIFSNWILLELCSIQQTVGMSEEELIMNVQLNGNQSSQEKYPRGATPPSTWYKII